MSSDQKISRERILAGAVAILDSGQCADLTVDALARSLRMSKSTLYKHFSSKDDVIVEMVNNVCECAEDELRSIEDVPTCAGRLTTLAAIMGNHGQRLPRAVLVDRINLPHACSLRLGKTRDAFASIAEQIVDIGLRTGEFRCPDPRLAAIAFVASADAVLFDGATRGLAGHRLDTLSALFLPGLLAE